jgi:hypothetical protein
MAKCCFFCKSKIYEDDLDEFKLDKDDKPRCIRCYIELLRDKIKCAKSSIYYMDLELKALLNKCYIWSDDDSDSYSDSDHLYLDNNTN